MAEYLKVRIREQLRKYPKAPLEDEFAAWLRKRIPLKYKRELSETTIEKHIQLLRSGIARRGIAGYLTSFESERNKRATQRYYKEFLAEHFAHILLPLLRERSSSTPASPEEPHQQHDESPHERTR